MNTKLKFTLLGLTALCLVSLVFNMVLCSRKVPMSEVQPQETVTNVADSLKIVELRDSTKMLESKIQALSENNVGTSTAMESLKQRNTTLERGAKEASTKLTDAENKNKEYLGEIHRLIKEIDYAVDNNRPAKKIKVEAKYREKK